MFGLRWSESQALSRYNPKEIALKKDDADAMWIVCHVLHHRNEVVPRHLIPPDMLKLAVLIDKYDFGLALEYAIPTWLANGTSTNKSTVRRQVTAAILLQNPEAFRKEVYNLLLHVKEPYSYLFLDEETYPFIPLKFISKPPQLTFLVVLPS